LEPARPDASRAWLVYAYRTSYTGEVAEIVWRTGGSIALLVDNLPDVEPSPLGRVAAPAALLPLTTPGHRYLAAAQARSLGIESFPALGDPSPRHRGHPAKSIGALQIGTRGQSTV
jgi:hypothetical protein